MRRPETEEAPKTEPVIVPEVFVTEIEFEIGGDHARITYYSLVNGDAPERRVVARLAMPLELARGTAARFLSQLRAKGDA